MTAEIIFAELRAIREDIGDLGTKTDKGFKEMAAVYAAHELKDSREFDALRAEIAPLKATNSSLKWAVRGGIGLLCAGAVDFLFDHLPHLLAGGMKP